MASSKPRGKRQIQSVKRKHSYHPELQETLFTWKLENINLRMGQSGIALDSPCFSIDPINATRMFLRLVSLSDRNETLSIQLHRSIDNGPTLITLRYRFQILDGCQLDGEPQTITTGRGTRAFRIGTHRLRPDHPDAPRSFLWKRQLYDPRKELAIRCHILPFQDALLNLSDDEEEDADALRLSLDLTLLYQEGSSYDVVLSAGEETFKAHRSILCGRSPTFAKELEKYSSDTCPVELKSELQAPVLKALLKYLYTGILADEIPDLDSEMYCAAAKYQVTDLKWKLYAFPKRSFAHTRFNSEVKAFNWSLRGFGDMETMRKVSSPLFTMEYPVPVSFHFTLYVTANTDIPIGNQIIPNVKISLRKVSSEKSKLISLYCKLSVIDAGRRLDISCSDYHLFDNEEDWQFPPFLNTYKLCANRVNYLPNNTLSILCEFIVSDRNYRSHVESTALETFLQNPEDLRSFAMDIRDMYNNRKYSDIILKAVDGKVPAHKAILCARCPILKACIEQIERLKIIYLAATKEAVNKLLWYLYTGEYPALEDYKIAMELHLLSSNVKLPNLNEYCKEYMISAVCTDNVLKILEFAEQHKETQMYDWLEEYISAHREEIDEAAKLELLLEYERRRAQIRSQLSKCTIL